LQREKIKYLKWIGCGINEAGINNYPRAKTRMIFT